MKREKKRNLQALAFAIPAILILGIFVYFPLIKNFIYSFQSFTLSSTTKEWVGLDNYRHLLSDKTILVSLKNNILYAVISIVIQVGFSLFKTSLNKILNPESMSFKWISIVILSLSVAVKLWLSLFNRTLGKRINSKVMLATAADAMGDVVTTSATMLSIAVFGIFGVNIDGIVGIAVSVVVMIAGVNIAKDTLAPLIGEAIDPQLYEQISNFVESFEGILGTHDLIVHNYGPSKSMASIHAEVPNDVNVERSHEVIDQIEHEAARRFGLLLVIHMDPVETHDGRIREFRDMLGEVLTELDSRLSFHDFRMVDGVEHINLIFDLVVPREYKAAVQDNLKARISAAVRKRDPRCACVITVENSYLAEAQK